MCSLNQRQAIQVKVIVLSKTVNTSILQYNNGFQRFHLNAHVCEAFVAAVKGKILCIYVCIILILTSSPEWLLPLIQVLVLHWVPL